MQLDQEFSKVKIDITISESRIKDLEGLRDMTLSQIQDLIADKRKTEKENQEIDARIQGRGMTEAEIKAKQTDAEQEMIKKIESSLVQHTDNAGFTNDRLAEEEKEGKEMLESKIKQQTTLIQINEDLAEGKALAAKNREEIIRLQIKHSQLITLDEKLKKESKILADENVFYHKKNEEFELENAKLTKEISATLQKIDINNLLKEVDIEDLRLVAQNNKQMTSALHQLLNKWENISKIEADKP